MKVQIGYVQGVHGLRGDLKIKNRSEMEDRIYKVGNEIYLNDEKHVITACKFYKGFYLVTIDNMKDINKVEHYIGYDVFIDREILNLSESEYLLEDLIDLNILCDGENLGRVISIENNGKYNILVIHYEKEYRIPLLDEFVIKVDLGNKSILCKDIKGLIL